MLGAGRSGEAARHWVLVPVLLFLALHLRSLDYDFVWTDQAEIQYGLLIREPGHILAAFGEPMYRSLGEIAPADSQPYYRPLQVVTLSWIDQLLGRRPANFRAVLLAIGAATMAAFFFLVLALTGDARAAAVAASIVAAHPAGIEDYVWIAGYSAAYATLFICLSLLTVPLLMRARTRGREGLFIALGTLGLVFGLLGKEEAVVLPALTLACIVSLIAQEPPEPGERPWRTRLVHHRAALALVGAQGLVVLLYLLVLRPAVLGGMLTGAPPIRGDLALHLTTVMATWADRLAWVFAPLRSTTSDVVPLAGAASPMAWLGLLLLVSAPVVWLRLLRNGQAIAAFGWAWLWIAFLPTSGIAPLTHVVAVRYLSLCVFGSAFLWLAIIDRLAPSTGAPGRQWVSAALSVLLILVLSERTWARTPDWQSDFTLFGRAVADDPLYREGYYVLAVRLAEQRRFEEARARLDQIRVVTGRFGAHQSFLRTNDVALLLCKINLEIGDPEDSLRVLRQELRPDSDLVRTAPELMACAAKSLRRAGRHDEAAAIERALSHPR